MANLNVHQTLKRLILSNIHGVILILFLHELLINLPFVRISIRYMGAIQERILSFDHHLRVCSRLADSCS